MGLHCAELSQTSLTALMLVLQSPCYNPAHDLANNDFEHQTLAIAIFPIYNTTLAAKWH